MKRLLSLCLAMMLMLSGCAAGETAQDATQNALAGIKSADSSAITKYFGADFINGGGGAKQPEELAQAIVKNFDYEIISVDVEGKEATAKLKLTNVKMESVIAEASQKALVEAEKISALPDDKKPSQQEIKDKNNSMLTEALSNPDVELVTAEVEVTLTEKMNGWKIDASDAFIDAAMGGIASMEAESKDKK